MKTTKDYRVLVIQAHPEDDPLSVARTLEMGGLEKNRMLTTDKYVHGIQRYSWRPSTPIVANVIYPEINPEVHRHGGDHWSDDVYWSRQIVSVLRDGLFPFEIPTSCPIFYVIQIPPELERAEEFYYRRKPLSDEESSPEIIFLEKVLTVVDHPIINRTGEGIVPAEFGEDGSLAHLGAHLTENFEILCKNWEKHYGRFYQY